MANLLVSDIIKMAEKQLNDAGIDEAKQQAEQIYCLMKNFDKMRFFMQWSKEAGEIEAENYFKLVAQRATYKPIQLIFGETEFMGYPFKVRENVLIPRMDTEVVVEEAEKIAQNKDSVLDLCCGSGIIGIALMKKAAENKKTLKVTSSDMSEEAVALTAENAQLNGVRLEITQGDLFEPIKKKKYDLIVSNPPYIESDVIPTLDVEVKDYDPLTALDGGEDGLDFYKRIIDEAPEHLKKKGRIIFEIGHNQGTAVAELLKASGAFEDIEITKDLAGHDRAVKAYLAGKKKK